jgi:hypothetical protein
MKDNSKCSLCKHETFKFYITFCWSHPDSPMVVSTTHKPHFSEEEKNLIKKMFPDKRIRWEPGDIPEHAHAHIVLEKTEL